VRKNRIYVQALQKAFGLPVRADDRYSAGYIAFMKRAVALRTANVAQERLAELLELEKKILRLLNVHPLNDTSTWYLDANCEPSGRTLLLTGFDVEFALNGSIQPGLDFGSGENEMFKSHEMGENLQEILERYVDLRNKLLVKTAEEIPVVRNSLKLASSLVRSAGFE
jgi:hypothetical protein